MKVHLPNSAFLGNIDTFLRSIDPSNKDLLEVTFNKKWMSLHPVVLSIVGALGDYVKNTGGRVVCGELEATSKYYLERMGLLKILGLEVPVHAHEPAGRFIPLTHIHDSDDLSCFITDMIPLLRTPAQQAEPIEYVVSELVRNVFEHAQSSIGAVVCAQFFKKSNRVSIGVCDVGIGIRSTIQRSHLVDDDISALKLSLTPGVTGVTSKAGGDEVNAGAGLFFIKSIAKVNRDFFMIYSGDAMYKLLKVPAGKKIRLCIDPFDDRYSQMEKLPYWQGTAVGIDISLEQHQRFEELLDMIRKAYRPAISGRKKKPLKKARFI